MPHHLVSPLRFSLVFYQKSFEQSEGCRSFSCLREAKGGKNVDAGGCFLRRGHWLTKTHDFQLWDQSAEASQRLHITGYF
jgi:hypothetical protein